MGWFLEWWQGIGLVGQIMACTAIPASLVLILQAVLMLIGAGFGEDTDGADGFESVDSDGADFEIEGFDGDVSDAIFEGIDTDSEGLEAYGEIGLDTNIGEDSVGNSTETVRIITVRGIIAFFAIGGWAGLAAITTGVPTIWSVQIALLSGVAAMILASVVIRFALRMQSSGNIDLRNALSQTGQVYITIPPSRSNTGKVMMLLQERFIEIEAVTDNPEAIKPKTKVEIIGMRDSDCLVVRPVTDEEI